MRLCRLRARVSSYNKLMAGIVHSLIDQDASSVLRGPRPGLDAWITSSDPPCLDKIMGPPLQPHEEPRPDPLQCDQKHGGQARILHKRSFFVPILNVTRREIVTCWCRQTCSISTPEERDGGAQSKGMQGYERRIQGSTKRLHEPNATPTRKQVGYTGGGNEQGRHPLW